MPVLFGAVVRRSYQRKKKLVRRASQLKKDQPPAERWFWHAWEELGMLHPRDRSNTNFGYYIPDVRNTQYAYVIEVDDPHKTPEQQEERDRRKDEFYRSQGYLVVRVRAYNSDDLTMAVDKIKARRLIGRLECRKIRRTAMSKLRTKFVVSQKKQARRTNVSMPIAVERRPFVPRIIVRRRGEISYRRSDA